MAKDKTGSDKALSKRSAIASAGKVPVSSRSEIAAFLSAAKSVVPAAAGSGRLAFALDATMSRQPTWDSACKLQAEALLTERRASLRPDAVVLIERPDELVKEFALGRCTDARTGQTYHPVYAPPLQRLVRVVDAPHQLVVQLLGRRPRPPL